MHWQYNEPDDYLEGIMEHRLHNVAQNVISLPGHHDRKGGEFIHRLYVSNTQAL